MVMVKLRSMGAGRGICSPVVPEESHMQEARAHAQGRHPTSAYLAFQTSDELQWSTSTPLDW